MVITSSAAVLAIYAVGFVRTQAAADRISAAASQFQSSQANQAPVSVPPTTIPSTTASDDNGSSTDQGTSRSEPTSPAAPTKDTGTSTGGSAGNLETPAVEALPPAQPPAPTPTATAAPSTSSRYRDGTYSGTGMSRHGDIAAQVTVNGGKIVSTQITGCYTRYPCSRIADLRGEVVSQQSTNVDMVSGATDSSEAFLQAIDNALQKALG